SRPPRHSLDCSPASPMLLRRLDIADQILEIAGEHTQSMKFAMLDAIVGLESAHKALTDGLS
ncbi:hypothetical protein, partial [Brevibacterium casei]|uniref:hypothetical protein n=1 Tax=Brevibacterium casei TaxID=33889 RepID=UPI001C92DF83